MLRSLSEVTVKRIFVVDELNTRGGSIHLVGSVPIDGKHHVTLAAVLPRAASHEHQKVSVVPEVSSKLVMRGGGAGSI